MGRIVAIDFGEKRIGLAVSDLNKQIAFPFETIENQPKLNQTIALLLDRLKEKKPIERFVIGLPLHLDGQESSMSQKVRIFGSLLSEISLIEVDYFDERLSSKQVDLRLKEQNFNRKKRAQFSDVLSAQLILEAYLHRYSNF